jgi:starvation-inducible DNA-binding protein
MKNYRKLGFDSEEAKSVVEALNKLLANYHIHYQKLRSYHWNVEGHSFFELHEFFEQEYEAVKVQIDEIAERIRVFGKKPMSTLKEYLSLSEIEETGNDLNADEMSKEILSDFEIILSLCIDAHEKTTMVGDLASSDLLIAYIKRTEKSFWMLSSFAGENAA